MKDTHIYSKHKQPISVSLVSVLIIQSGWVITIELEGSATKRNSQMTELESVLTSSVAINVGRDLVTISTVHSPHTPCIHTAIPHTCTALTVKYLSKYNAFREESNTCLLRLRAYTTFQVYG